MNSLIELPVDRKLIDVMKPEDYGYIDVCYMPWQMWFRFYYDKLASGQYRNPHGRRFRYPRRRQF